MEDSLPGSAERTRYAVGAFVALVVGSVTFAYRYLSFERFPNDHFVHLSRAQQVVMGALPVRDYSEYQAPLAVMLSAWTQMILGPGLRSELLLVCTAFAVAAAVTYLVGAGVSGSIGAGLAAALILTAATPVSYSYPKVLPYALTFGAAWLYVRKPDTPGLWLLAASVVFAGLLRHDHAIVLGAGAIVAVVARQETWPARARAISTLALAGVVFAAPYVAWVQYYEGVFNYIGANLEAGTLEARLANWAPPRFEIDRTRPLWVRLADPQEPVVHVRWQPQLSEDARHRAETLHGLRLMGEVEDDVGQYEITSVSPESLERLVRDPAVKEAAGIDRATFRLEDRRPLSAHFLQYVVLPGEGLRPAFVALLYYLSWFVPLVAIVLLVVRWNKLSPQVRSITAMLVAVQLIMCREMLRDTLATRVRDVVAPLALLVALMPAITCLQQTSTAPLRWLRLTTLAALFLVAAVAAAGAGVFGQNLRETGIRHGWDGLVARTAEIRERYATPYERIGMKPSGLVEYVISCTPERARILSLANVSELFFYSHRGFAGGYDALRGFYTTDRQASQVLERLSHEDVPLVILDSETDEQMMNAYPRIARYVKQRYHEAGRFNIDATKAFIILAENDRKPVGSFVPGDLPCFAAPERTELLPNGDNGFAGS
jgi:hypothetical protein